MDKSVSKLAATSFVAASAATLCFAAVACSSSSNSPAPGASSTTDAGSGGSNSGGGSNGGSSSGGKGGTANTGGGGAANTGGGGVANTGGKGGTTNTGGGGATNTGGGGATNTGGGGTSSGGTGGDGGVDVDGCVPSDPSLPTSVPDAIKVPDGVDLVATFHATGTQDYQCTGTPVVGDAGIITYAWTFIGPEASLFNSCDVKVGKHQAGPKGPTGPEWISLDDGSLVEGAKQAASAVTGAVPQLILKATDHSGTGIFTPVTYIQRLDTKGGVAPDNSTCTDANVDDVQKVDYTANYYFYSGPKDGG